MTKKQEKTVGLVLLALAGGALLAGWRSRGVGNREAAAAGSTPSPSRPAGGSGGAAYFGGPTLPAFATSPASSASALECRDELERPIDCQTRLSSSELRPARSPVEAVRQSLAIAKPASPTVVARVVETVRQATTQNATKPAAGRIRYRVETTRTRPPMLVAVVDEAGGSATITPENVLALTSSPASIVPAIQIPAGFGSPFVK